MCAVTHLLVVVGRKKKKRGRAKIKICNSVVVRGLLEKKDSTRVSPGDEGCGMKGCGSRLLVAWLFFWDHTTPRIW